MAKYKAKEGFGEMKNNPLGLGEVQCLVQGGTIELDLVPDALKEFLVEVGTKQVKTETKPKITKGAK